MHTHIFGKTAMVLSYFLKCFVSILPHRKVEDLQFRVEEESITKGDLEVKPLQLSKRVWVPVFSDVDEVSGLTWPERAAEGRQEPGPWPAGPWVWPRGGDGAPPRACDCAIPSPATLKFSVLFPCALEFRALNWN